MKGEQSTHLDFISQALYNGMSKREIRYKVTIHHIEMLKYFTFDFINDLATLHL